MRKPIETLSAVLLTAAPLLAASVAAAPPQRDARDAWCSNVVLPQVRAFHVDPTAPAVRVAGVRAEVSIVDGVAVTTLHVSVANDRDRDAEAELLLPVPDGAIVHGFDFEGAGVKPSARLLPRDEARSTYDAIVAKLRDPALLEFAGAALVRTSVFPVRSASTLTVRLKYEHILDEDSLGGDSRRWDYELPRSESLAADVPWELALEVRSSRPIADVYSPTHDLVTVDSSAGRRTLRSREGSRPQAGSLRVSVLLSEGALTTTLFTSADPDRAGGWFLLLAGLGELPAGAPTAPREVTLVLDRSGSMAGEKFDQAKAAARQVLEGLAFGESVQIVDYSSTVERFAPAAVVKTTETLPALRAYLDGLAVGGGTNLDGALAAALSAPATPGTLPVVLFLTDGLPTEGETREPEIRRRIEAENAHARRVFTFGVGNDVNAPLLDALAVTSRARATYVRPTEDVERAVAGVFSALSGPVVTDLTVTVKDADGNESTRLVRDLYPRVLPDLFRGDRLVLVGRYLAAAPVRIELAGKHAGAASKWTLDHDLAAAKQVNGFVKRLWAMRRIADLEDELRRAGADPGQLATLRQDPRYGEIVREMLELATRHGVLTDSTAFLALEGTALGNAGELAAAAADRGFQNAQCRTGIEGVAAQQNVAINRDQCWANFDNALYDSSGARVANRTVQTIQGRTFFLRGARWVDGELALKGGELAPDREVTFGSAEHAALVEALRAAGCAGRLSLDGEILLRAGSETVLIRPAAEPAYTSPKE